MAPKKNAATLNASPAAYKTPQSNIQPSKVAASSSKTTTTSAPRNAQDAQQILYGIYNNYLSQTPQRVKLLDAFMAFLVVVGVLQFVYCVLAGNYVRLPTLYMLWTKKEGHSLTLARLAFQRLPRRLLSNSRPIRPHSKLAHPNKPREQGRFREDIA